MRGIGSAQPELRKAPLGALRLSPSLESLTRFGMGDDMGAAGRCGRRRPLRGVPEPALLSTFGVQAPVSFFASAPVETLAQGD